MFSKDNLIFSYTTKQAVEDGVLIKTDPKQSLRAAIKFPVFFTNSVWEKYVEIPKELESVQNFNGRLGDIVYMFAFQAKKCSGSVLSFRFTCQIPKSFLWQQNEAKSDISFQHREITLKAVISAQDINDPSPTIFIMMPWED